MPDLPNDILDVIKLRSKLSQCCYTCSCRRAVEANELNKEDITGLINLISYILGEDIPGDLIRDCKDKDHGKSLGYLIAYWRELSCLKELKGV